MTEVQKEKELSILELLLKSAKAITSEVELGKLVQIITDVGTELSGAHFGAFFYNTRGKDGEEYVLYTISGVPKEAFSKFPLPRNTKVFAPTFAGEKTVRYDDVTTARNYGQNEPYKGMPPGHLPVKSYLATSVISPINNEVIGGLFFGHPEAGIFTENTERLIEGVASQAAIAMGNAHLFEEKKSTERNLREQKEQYYSIFNSTSDAIIIYDTDGSIAEVNPAATRVLGYTYEEFVGANGKFFFNDPLEFEGMREIVRSGRNYSGKSLRLKKGGSLVHVEVSASSFIFRGHPHIMAVLRDITTDVTTEEALQKSKVFAEVITNAAPVALWMSDVNAEIIYINRTWIDWTGKPFYEHLGKGWILGIIEEDREKTLKGFISAFDERRFFVSDFRIKKANGEVRWCTASGSPYYNTSGVFQGYAGSWVDITERKIAEEKLATQNVLINTIANNTLQALFMMDAKQICTYMNPAAERMTGFKLQEVREKPLHYYVHHTHLDGRHFPIEECPIDRALPTKMQSQGEDFFIHKDGSFYPVAFTASPIIDNGVPVGTVIEVRNTTEEKRIQEELRNKDRAAKELLEEKVKERTSELEKSNYELLQFTSVASHDLKEPVRKVSIYSRMIKERFEGLLDSIGQKYLNNIITSSERMIKLIEDLLSFSRITHTDPKLLPVDLNIVLKDIVNDLEIPIKEKKAIINISPMPVVKGIELQLGQIFQNLISNSLKFSKPGTEPVITLTCGTIEVETRPFWRIVYKDNGIGFNSKYAEKIFDIFQRLHSKNEYEGTGVGLAIVKKIVTFHGGFIKASGEEGIGATFEILFPKN